MSEHSAIEWTDATWNPTTGCTKVSPGCAHCYAETFAERFRGVPGHPYEQGFDLRLVPEKLTEPLTWKKPRRIFVNSMSDLFQDGVPDQFIIDVFGIMALAHWHTFQVLTKRERMRAFLQAGDHGIIRQFSQIQAGGGIGPRGMFDALDIKRRDNVEWRWPLPNVWLGPSIENQHFADERFPIACELGEAGWNVMVSMEPLLGPVTIPQRFLSLGPKAWVVTGGESGRGARPFAHDWARSIIQQCKSAGVACFMKQLGANHYPLYFTDKDGVFIGGTTDLSGRRSKGGDMSEWPEDLRVRQVPPDAEGAR